MSEDLIPQDVIEAAGSSELSEAQKLDAVKLEKEVAAEKANLELLQSLAAILEKSPEIFEKALSSKENIYK